MQTRFRQPTSTSTAAQAGPLPPASSSPYPTGRFQQSQQQIMIQPEIELPTVMTHPIATNPGGSRGGSVRQGPSDTLPEVELTSVGSAPPRLHSQKRKRTYLQEVHESTTRGHVNTPFGVGVAPPSYHTRVGPHFFRGVQGKKVGCY
jgi:hypothetical protein